MRNSTLSFFNGARIHVSKDIPRMRLSQKVPVSDEFRAEMDAWMLEFFGTFNLLDEGQVIHDKDNNIMHMTPRTYAALQKVAQDKEGSTNG